MIVVEIHHGEWWMKAEGEKGLEVRDGRKYKIKVGNQGFLG